MMMKKESRKYVLMMFAMVFLLFVCIGAKKVHAGDYSSAETLPLNGAWGSEYWLTDEDNEQWYKIVVPSDGKLTYKVMGYCEVRYELYDEVCYRQFHSSHTGGSASSPDTNTRNDVLSKGIYYLKITSYYGSRGKYKLNASFVSFHTNDDYADTYDSPKQISLGTVITGALTRSDTEDWYHVVIPANGYYHVKITAFFGLCQELYNYDLSSRISWRSCDAGESSPRTIEYDEVLSSGNYYFKMTRYYDDMGGRYTLQISPLSQSACAHDYEKTYVDATYTSQGYTLHRCSKCGSSYKDDYRSKRTLSTPYIYSLYAGKKKATVSWGTVSNASGYEISYKVKNTTKIAKVKGGSKTRKTIKKLKSKKKCVVRIRAYRKEGSKTAYSKWSSKRSVKVR